MIYVSRARWTVGYGITVGAVLGAGLFGVGSWELLVCGAIGGVVAFRIKK